MDEFTEKRLADELNATPAQERTIYETQNAGPVDEVRAGFGDLKKLCLSLNNLDMIHNAYSIPNPNTPGKREVIKGFGEYLELPITCPGCGEVRKDMFMVMTDKSWVIECTKCKKGWFIPRDLNSLANKMLEQKMKADQIMMERSKK